MRRACDLTHPPSCCTVRPQSEGSILPIILLLFSPLAIVQAISVSIRELFVLCNPNNLIFELHPNTTLCTRAYLILTKNTCWGRRVEQSFSCKGLGSFAPRRALADCRTEPLHIPLDFVCRILFLQFQTLARIIPQALNKD